MKFTNKLVKLTNVRSFTSKKGNQLTFLSIADPTTYESCELMPAQNLDVSSLSVGSDYCATVDIAGQYSNVMLVPVK